jgi:hypothetical protein
VGMLLRLLISFGLHPWVAPFSAARERETAMCPARGLAGLTRESPRRCHGYISVGASGAFTLSRSSSARHTRRRADRDPGGRLRWLPRRSRQQFAHRWCTLMELNNERLLSFASGSGAHHRGFLGTASYHGTSAASKLWVEDYERLYSAHGGVKSTQVMFGRLLILNLLVL